MHMLLLNRHMRIWPTPCGGIEKEKAKSDLSNKIPLLASFERSFYGLFLTKAALLPFLLTPASKQAASLLIKLAELHIYEEARKGPTLLLSSASAYEEELSKNDVVHSFITKLWRPIVQSVLILFLISNEFYGKNMRQLTSLNFALSETKFKVDQV